MDSCRSGCNHCDIGPLGHCARFHPSPVVFPSLFACACKGGVSQAPTLFSCMMLSRGLLPLQACMCNYRYGWCWHKKRKRREEVLDTELIQDEKTVTFFQGFSVHVLFVCSHAACSWLIFFVAYLHGPYSLQTAHVEWLRRRHGGMPSVFTRGEMGNNGTVLHGHCEPACFVVS